jgi:hypothetical protein
MGDPDDYCKENDFCRALRTPDQDGAGSSPMKLAFTTWRWSYSPVSRLKSPPQVMMVSVG